MPNMSHYLSNNFNFLSNSGYCINIYYQNNHGLRTKLFNHCTNFILSYYDAYILTETQFFNDILNVDLRFFGYLRTSNYLPGGGSLIAVKKELICFYYIPDSILVSKFLFVLLFLVVSPFFFSWCLFIFGYQSLWIRNSC